jgi:hypothetical protein
MDTEKAMKHLQERLHLAYSQRITWQKLWIEWFEFSGNPWEYNDNYGRTYCFFCAEEYPNHSANCVFIRAKSLIEKERK